MKFNKTSNLKRTEGTSFSGIVLRMDLQQLIDVFGSPSIIGSGDGKTQLTWIFIKAHKVVTIYDYKEEKNINNIVNWHVGCKDDLDVIEFLKEKDIEVYVK